MRISTPSPLIPSVEWIVVSSALVIVVMAALAGILIYPDLPPSLRESETDHASDIM